MTALRKRPVNQTKREDAKSQAGRFAKGAGFVATLLAATLRGEVREALGLPFVPIGSGKRMRSREPLRTLSEPFAPLRLVR